MDGPFQDDVNYGLNKFDVVVVDEASMILAPTFQALATTFNRLNLHPVVVFPGDKYQQQPLETVVDRVSATTSIIYDQQTFHAGNAIKHFLYQQFRIVDEEYAKFLDLICYTEPTRVLLKAGPRPSGQWPTALDGTAARWPSPDFLQFVSSNGKFTRIHRSGLGLGVQNGQW